MDRNQTIVLIVEESEIIRLGLVEILKNQNITQIFVEPSIGQCNWKTILSNASSVVLIGNPDVFKGSKKVLDELSQTIQILSVGLIYSYYHPKELVGFDVLVYLSDAKVKIQGAVEQLINSSELSEASVSDNLLSEREKEVLKWLSSGYSTKQIAETLFISTHTVNAHRKNIMRKLDINTISGLTIYAVLNNIIELEL